MKKGSILLRWAVVTALLVAFSMSGIEAIGSTAPSSADGEKRADGIVIDSLKAYGKLEEAPVVFLHDQHTEALKKQGKDCTACHETKDNRLVTKFKRVKDVSLEVDKEIYHSNCIGCHKQAASKGKTGPTDVACRSCHSKKPAPASSWKEVRMDKSLHYRHVASDAIPSGGEDANCAACHHKLDKASKKLVPAKGEEGSCNYCHKQEATKEVRSARDAAHVACISCHMELEANKVKSGPDTCAGCHTKAAQDEFKVVKEVPRLKRNQPDVVLMTVADDKAPKAKKGLMEPVAFNHKAHEQYNDDCSTCHPKSLKVFGTATDSEDAEAVDTNERFELMHAADNPGSCVGCHNVKKQDPNCAGCHDMIPAGRTSDQSCAACHQKALKKGDEDEVVAVKVEEIAAMDKEAKAELAAGMVEARTMAGTYAMKDIPEKIVIDDLVDKFEASEFPHRKIVESMWKRIKDNDLAGAFHTSKGTFCQGCHHNSPASLTPPRCASCHGPAFEGKDGRPGLKAAFHQQCIGCHKSMKLEKPVATACADCHKERK